MRHYVSRASLRHARQAIARQCPLTGGYLVTAGTMNPDDNGATRTGQTWIETAYRWRETDEMIRLADGSYQKAEGIALLPALTVVDTTYFFARSPGGKQLRILSAHSDPDAYGDALGVYITVG